MERISGNEKDGDRSERGSYNKAWRRDIVWKKDDDGRDLFQRKYDR